MQTTGKLWFKRRRFGWGWTPVTVEGWAIVVIYLVGVAIISANWQNDRPVFYAALAASTLLLIAVGYLKGEPPKWRWGKED